MSWGYLLILRYIVDIQMVIRMAQELKLEYSEDNLCLQNKNWLAALIVSSEKVQSLKNMQIAST